MNATHPRWRAALVSWLAVYPTITAVGAATLPFTGGFPWAVRTLVLTTLMVPLVVYATGPAADSVVALVEKTVSAALARLRRLGRGRPRTDPQAPARVPEPSTPARSAN